MDGTFLMISTSSIIRQSLGKIAQCCRCENVVFVFFYRQDAAKRQTAGIKFTHRPKIRFFAPSPEHRAIERCIVRTSIALPFIARFRRGLQVFFQME